MKLWTIQDEAFWLTLEEHGVLGADGRRLSMGREFRRQYRWMREMMKERVPGSGGRPPIWCWREKPDMRGIWGPGGLRVVRAALEIPAERVLVSDFELWHVPLNNGYLARGEAEDRAFEDEENRRGFWRARYESPSGWWMSPDSDYPPDLRERVLRSWERIFPDRWGELEDPDWWGDGQDRRLQACVEEIRPEDVVRAERFVTRRGAWKNGR